MTPELRSIADRFILDAANLKYLATNLPPGALERRVEALDWTVRQAIGHFVVWQEAYDEIVPRMLTGNALPAAFRGDDFNANGAEETRGTPLPELLARMQSGLSRLLTMIDGMPDSPAGAPGRQATVDFLAHCASHVAEHAIDLVDTLPELRFDPMVLNWVLYADYSHDPRSFARQQALMADVREHFVDEDEEVEEDK
jgi:hypothetical protein